MFMILSPISEDRILAFEIVSKKNYNYTTKFVKESTAVTDVPTTLLELTKQRRRWLNGSFFALLYYYAKFWKLLTRSGHSMWRKTALITQFIYLTSILFFNWFGVALLFLSFVMIIRTTVDALDLDMLTTPLFMSFFTLYLCLTTLQILFGLGSKPVDVQRIYSASAVLYAIIIFISICLSIYNISLGLSIPILVISLLGFGGFFLSALVFGRFPTILSTFFHVSRAI